MSNWLDFKDTSNLFKSVYVKGFVDISGGDFIARNGNLYIHGDASLNHNVFIKNKLVIGTTTDSDYHLDISGDVKISNDIVIERDASLNSHLLVNDDVSLNSRLFVNKDVSLNSHLFVADDASFNSDIYVSNNINSNVINNISIFQF
jgi:predicted acyltransferase (DUF342 family)